MYEMSAYAHARARILAHRHSLVTRMRQETPNSSDLWSGNDSLDKLGNELLSWRRTFMECDNFLAQAMSTILFELAFTTCHALSRTNPAYCLSGSDTTTKNVRNFNVIPTDLQQAASNANSATGLHISISH